MRFGPAEMLLLVITVLGWAIVLLLARHMVRDSADQVRALLAKQKQSPDALRPPVADSPPQIEQATPPAAGPGSQREGPASTKLPEPPVKSAVDPSLPVIRTDEVSPETLLVIAAAVASYLGQKVQVRCAHLITTGTSAWAQQGRVFVQASHNLQRARF
jgi:methylmalonyl-CoA carboxyltransferase large subunit